jgi:hypothetical protein
LHAFLKQEAEKWLQWFLIDLWKQESDHKLMVRNLAKKNSKNKIKIIICHHFNLENLGSALFILHFEAGSRKVMQWFLIDFRSRSLIITGHEMS